MVLAHGRALLTSAPPGATSYLDADLRDTETILSAAADILDFRQPVALLLIGILQLIPDEDNPRAIVARLVEAIPPGSWLAVFHPASDILADQIGKAARRVSARSASRTTLRSRAEVARFFDGLHLMDPGLVQVHRWQPGSAAPDDGEQVAGYAGLAPQAMNNRIVSTGMPGYRGCTIPVHPPCQQSPESAPPWALSASAAGGMCCRLANPVPKGHAAWASSGHPLNARPSPASAAERLTATDCGISRRPPQCGALPGSCRAGKPEHVLCAGPWLSASGQTAARSRLTVRRHRPRCRAGASPA
jgi:S-adenosyl methyltransferase